MAFFYKHWYCCGTYQWECLNSQVNENFLHSWRAISNVFHALLVMRAFLYWPGILAWHVHTAVSSVWIYTTLNHVSSQNEVILRGTSFSLSVYVIQYSFMWVSQFFVFCWMVFQDLFWKLVVFHSADVFKPIISLGMKFSL